ncbi:hypothetical protein OKW48_004367 [Paraburkholderia youngii]|uniref:hypothetical protein n=1 Tax=Paraburkholderia youngii TaxID=2782701 RepID=UPI003D22276C
MTGVMGPQLRACLHAHTARAWVVIDILAGDVRRPADLAPGRPHGTPRTMPGAT